MSNEFEVPFRTTLEVRDTCLCLHVQRAARVLARRFDAALRPVGLTNGQFSLLMSLNRPLGAGVPPAGFGGVADLLGMDRSTLTAALKPLERRGLVEVRVDAQDRRGRVMVLTGEGHRVLTEAVPIWRRVHSEIEEGMGTGAAGRVREDLGRVTQDGLVETRAMAKPS